MCKSVCLLFSACLFWPVALEKERTTVVAQIKQLQSEAEPIIKMFEDPETTPKTVNEVSVFLCLKEIML